MGQPFAYSDAEAHPLVRSLLEDQAALSEEVVLDIHQGDLMFQYTLDEHYGDRDLALVHYFRTGLDACRIMRRLVDWRFGTAAEGATILDFASGYGRTTRFLVEHHPPSSTWVSDLDPQAVRFQQQRFGVEGLVSTARPQEFDCERRFDAIFALSFFTHLPRATFEPWLHTLYTQLDDEGILVFSVFDEGAMLPQRTMPQDGFYFEEVSENADLDFEDYGSTWVREGFLKDLLQRVSGGEASYRRLARGLWHAQDLYVVSRNPVDFSTLDFDPGPRAFLETCFLGAKGELVVSGWATHEKSQEVRVQLLLNGDLLQELEPHDLRPDVTQALAHDSSRPCGWEMRWAARTRTTHGGDLLMIRVKSANGTQHVVQLGTVQAISLFLKLHHTQARLGGALARIRRLEADLGYYRQAVEDINYDKTVLEIHRDAMQASKFWKLHDAWFWLKRRLGLVPEKV